VKLFRTKDLESHVKRGPAFFPGRVWGYDVLGEIIAEWRVYVLDGAIVWVGRHDKSDGEREFALNTLNPLFVSIPPVTMRRCRLALILV